MKFIKLFSNLDNAKGEEVTPPCVCMINGINKLLTSGSQTDTLVISDDGQSLTTANTGVLSLSPVKHSLHVYGDDTNGNLGFNEISSFALYNGQLYTVSDERNAPSTGFDYGGCWKLTLDENDEVTVSEQIWTAVTDNESNEANNYIALYQSNASGKTRYICDCEAVTLDELGNVYVGVERWQSVIKLTPTEENSNAFEVVFRAKDHISEFNPSYTWQYDTMNDSNYPNYSKNGIEGIAWYKNNQIFISNQTSPAMIILFDITSNSVVSQLYLYNVEGLQTAEVGDLEYISELNELWFIDSDVLRIYRLDIGEDNSISYNGKYINLIDIDSDSNTEGLAVDYANRKMYVCGEKGNKIFIYNLPETL